MKSIKQGLCLSLGIGLYLVVAGSLSAKPLLPEVQRDWQLPYVVTESLIFYADTRGTWLRRPGGEERLLLGGGRGFPPVVTSERVYATNINGDLLAWDRGEGEVLWRRRFRGWVFPPLVMEGALYLGGRQHRLFQLDPDTGATVDSVALTNEAIFQPVAWHDGQVAVGVYSRYWQVVDRSPLRLAQRLNVPQPPKTATPDGRFLAQSGTLFQLQADGGFSQIVTGQSPVNWLDNETKRLYWSTGRRVWRSHSDGVDCLKTQARVTHLDKMENGFRLQTTNFYGTLTTVSLSDEWGLPLPSNDKENINEKNVDRTDRGTDQQPVDRHACRTLRHH